MNKLLFWVTGWLFTMGLLGYESVTGKIFMIFIGWPIALGEYVAKLLGG